MDTTRTQLKTLNSQFSFFMKQKTAAKTNLIALLDTTYPGVNKLFDSPVRADGSEKWVDFAYSFWHVDCVRKAGITAFTDRYKRFCKHHGYEFQEAKANAIYKDIQLSNSRNSLYQFEDFLFLYRLFHHQEFLQKFLHL